MYYNVHEGVVLTRLLAVDAAGTKPNFVTIYNDNKSKDVGSDY